LWSRLIRIFFSIFGFLFIVIHFNQMNINWFYIINYGLSLFCVSSLIKFYLCVCPFKTIFEFLSFSFDKHLGSCWFLNIILLYFHPFHRLMHHQNPQSFFQILHLNFIQNLTNFIFQNLPKPLIINNIHLLLTDNLQQYNSKRVII